QDLRRLAAGHAGPEACSARRPRAGHGERHPGAGRRGADARQRRACLPGRRGVHAPARSGRRPARPGRAGAAAHPAPRDDAPLGVLDFARTLHDGDPGGRLFRGLVGRAWWRVLLALRLAPVAGPMVAWLPTRRAGISMFVWVGTLGGRGRAALDALIDRYVALHVDAIRARLLPVALDVFHAHRERGDLVVDATGAPPELARATLALVAHADVPVGGPQLGPRACGIGAPRP